MAYEKQTWATGDTITAEKLNHMEDGIGAGGGSFVITFTENNESYTADKTTTECAEAVTSGMDIIAKLGSEIYRLVAANVDFVSFSFSSVTAYAGNQVLVSTLNYFYDDRSLSDTVEMIAYYINVS